MSRNYKWITPGRSVPRPGNRRGCLCEDEDTYKVECCKGYLINQGIGITRK